MSLHGLLSVTIGVPNVDETAAYYTDFGLTPGEGGWFSTADAGQQLRLLPADARGQTGTARVGPRPALRGLELLLVPEGPGG